MEIDSKTLLRSK